MPFITTFLYSQFFVTPLVPDHDFSGQTIIVTGSNTGLGFEAAKHFVRLNAAKVILAVRNVEKGEAAKREILETTRRTVDCIEVWLLDLERYDSVKQFVTRAQDLEQLDVVVENAGVQTRDFSMAEDSEWTITVNVISTFLLALMILPKMRESAAKFDIVPHLCVVSSEVHELAAFKEREHASIFDALNDPVKSVMSDR
jgi:NAD(P)-dependent dehydrogenase (short-subunit alcohol dehydrogenase family)